MLKKISEKKHFQDVTRELKILNEVKKIDGCIKIFDVISDVNSLSFVMPWYPFRDLYQHLNLRSEKVTEKEAQHICRQLIKILSDVHKMGIIHRNLNPESLLVADMNLTIVLSNFAFAIKETDLFTLNQFNKIGTEEFIPYEMLIRDYPGKGKKVWYDRRVDIWSLGVIIFELLYGDTPFYTPSQTWTEIKTCHLDFEFPKLLSGAVYTQAEDLFRRIFVKPEMRITLAEMKEHPWLVNEIK